MVEPQGIHLITIVYSVPGILGWCILGLGGLAVPLLPQTPPQDLTVSQRFERLNLM